MKTTEKVTLVRQFLGKAANRWLNKLNCLLRIYGLLGMTNRDPIMDFCGTFFA